MTRYNLILKLLIIAALISSLFAYEIVKQRPVDAASITQWNIDGAFLSKGVSRTAQANEYIAYLNYLKPVFGGANEICSSQIARIKAYTSYESYALPTFSGGTGRPDCGTQVDTIYYNALFRTSNLNYVDSLYYGFSVSPDSSPGRGMVCAKAAYIMFVYAGCVTHLSPYGSYPSANSYQLAQALMVAHNFFNGSQRSYFIGDLNARSTRSELNYAYSNYWEIDPRSSKRWTTTSLGGCGWVSSSGRGIDYIFGDKVGNNNAGLSGPVAATGSKSDHCLVFRIYD